jgi:cobalt-zinc-cadmium efflux system membrane fusion protein
MKTNSKRLALGGGTTALLVVLGLTAWHRGETKETTPAAGFQRQGNLILIPDQSCLRARLMFETARVETVESRLSAPAVVESDPQRFARIFPPVSGRLAKLHVQLGDRVVQGQSLASLTSPDFFASQNDYLKARTAVQLTSRALKRQQELQEKKIAAQKDVEQANSDYQSARSDLESATGKLLALGFNPETDGMGQPLQVVSPLAGRVVDMASAHGEFRNDATAPLMTVADLSTVWLTANVPEKDLRCLQQGQQIQASLAAYPGEVFTGKVQFIGDLLDPDLRTTKVRIALANPEGRLKPGMFGIVTFLGFPESRITLPATAIVQSGSAAFVFEQVKPWALQPREVSLGMQQGERTVIVRGLEPGATVLAKEGVLFQ